MPTTLPGPPKKREEFKNTRRCGSKHNSIKLDRKKTAGHCCKISTNNEYIIGTRINSFKARYSSIILSF
jgi:hypothetical protein